MDSDSQTGSRRGRKPRYQLFLGVRVSAAMKAEIDGIADAWDVDVSEVVRHALKAGLHALVEPGAGARPGEVRGRSGPDARRWWSSLDRPSRSRWGRELAHLEGPDFLEEAYRRAQESADQG